MSRKTSGTKPRAQTMSLKYFLCLRFVASRNIVRASVTRFNVCAHGFVPLVLLSIGFYVHIMVPAWSLNCHFLSVCVCVYIYKYIYIYIYTYIHIHTHIHI